MDILITIIILVALNLLITTTLVLYGLYRQHRFHVEVHESMLDSRYDPRDSNILCDIYRDRLASMMFGDSPHSSEDLSTRMREFSTDIPMDRFEIMPGSVRERYNPRAYLSEPQLRQVPVVVMTESSGPDVL